MPRSSKIRFSQQQNWWLAIAVILLAVFPLVFVRGEFGGTDDQAKGVIQEIHPTYEPWVQPFVQPASGEIASLLFASQAALGAGIIGYVIGLYKGRTQKESKPYFDRQNESSDR